MKLFKFFFIACLAGAIFTACDDDDDINDLSLNISGLQNLGSDYAYEGWIIVDNNPVSTGVFTVDDQGRFSSTSFPVDKDNLEKATAFVLTIEPSPDDDPAPSAVHLMAGDFNGSAASLSIGHAKAIGTTFTTAAGSYILATPTNGPNTNEYSGIWWLDPSEGPGATLTIPTIPDSWEYEGWAVIDGVPVTTGKFKIATGADQFNGYSGTLAAPPFPGEDFLVNAPTGVTFPTDLRGMTAVISVEPVPDNSPKPFLLKPLIATIPATAIDHMTEDMSNNASTTNPTGTVSR